MAEVLAVAASVASVSQIAAQIASSVIQLKSYLDQVKDAPEDIRTLVDEIEDLQILLSEIEDDQARNPYAAMLLETHSASRCLDHCKRGVERLRRVVDAMAVEFEDPKRMKMKWVAAKIIWKRDRIEKYRADLASAVRLLTLSHQIYTRSLIQIQPDIITSRVTQLMKMESAKIHSTISSPSSTIVASEFTDLKQTSQKDHLSRSRRMQYKRYLWNIHSFLLGRAWDFEVCRSEKGWTFSMSVYAVVSYSSPVARYCNEGDVESLQRLFSSRKATPFTICGERGYEVSLLELSAEQGHYEICQLLIDLGAGSPGTFETSLIAFSMNGARFNRDQTDKLLNLLALRSEVTIATLEYYRGPTSVFSTLLKHIDSPVTQLPLHERCDLAIRLAEHPCFTTVDVPLMVLGGSPIANDAMSYLNLGGTRRTFLHSIAANIGQLTACISIKVAKCSLLSHEEFNSRVAGWKSLVPQLLEGGADLHATSTRDTELFIRGGVVDKDKLITPLLSVFFRYYISGWVESEDLMGFAFNIWIELLHETGINLVEYGCKEKSLWASQDIPQEVVTQQLSRYCEYCFLRRRLIGFTYGPLPEDWIFWENEPTDEFTGDFWAMIDKREEVMPGSWIE